MAYARQVPAKTPQSPYGITRANDTIKFVADANIDNLRSFSNNPLTPITTASGSPSPLSTQANTDNLTADRSIKKLGLSQIFSTNGSIKLYNPQAATLTIKKNKNVI